MLEQHEQVISRSTWESQVKGGGTITLTAEKTKVFAALPFDVATAKVRKVKVSGPQAPRRRKGEQVAIFLPDEQIGYRWDGEQLDPFHDERAMAQALQVVHEVNPDVVGHLGDLIDLPSLSRFAQEPTFRGTSQAALNRAYEYLAQSREVAPNARILYVQGNHEARIEKELCKLVPELALLSRAGESEPVMSLRSLLHLDKLGIEYAGGYPAGELWVTDQLRVIHGDVVNSSGSTAAKIVDRDRFACTVFGHVHRSEFHAINVRSGRDAQRVVWAASPGTLARIDGAVPSFHGGSQNGKPRVRPENWVQGVGIARWVGSETPTWEWRQV